METITTNSINQNGCSVCATGEEKYTAFYPAHRPTQRYYQYDFRYNKDGKLFSTIAPTLEQCREKRDKWIQAKNYKRLFPSVLKKIQENKRLTKSDMGYQIGNVDPLHPFSLYRDHYTRADIVKGFNRMFGTSIQ